MPILPQRGISGRDPRHPTNILFHSNDEASDAIDNTLDAMKLVVAQCDLEIENTKADIIEINDDGTLSDTEREGYFSTLDTGLKLFEAMKRAAEIVIETWTALEGAFPYLTWEAMEKMLPPMLEILKDDEIADVRRNLEDMIEAIEQGDYSGLAI